MKKNTSNYGFMRESSIRALCLFLSIFLSAVAFSEGGRTPVRAKNGMVSSASRLASETGVQVLQQGGNAAHEKHGGNEPAFFYGVFDAQRWGQ